MKELATFGCSMASNYIRYQNSCKHRGLPYTVLTDQKRRIVDDWEIQEEYDTFDVYIAKHLGLKPINFAEPGSGNLRIFNNAIDYVTQNDNIDTLLMCWSSFNRHDFQLDPKTYTDKYTSITFTDDVDYNRELQQNLADIGALMYDSGFLFGEKGIDDFFRCSYIINEVCKVKNIDLYQCGMIGGINYENAIYLVSHPALSSIDTTKIFGWPFSKIIGGKTPRCYETSHYISEQDRHPNKQGHEYMANELMEFIDGHRK